MSAVFISYSRKEVAAARDLVHELAQRNIRSVYLDVMSNKCGDGWERKLYDRIRSCHAMIVLISRDYASSIWCHTEVRQARALRKHIFPVRIDDTEIDGLSDLQYIDLRPERTSGHDPYAALSAALREAQVPTGAWDDARAPYPGLDAFDEADGSSFFGREDEISGYVQRLSQLWEKATCRWLVLVGASGCGKSSLVRAGLIPALRRDPRRWIVVGPVRRGKSALDSLAIGFAQAFAQAGGERPPPVIKERLLDERPGAPLALASDLRCAAGQPEAAVLLVIDQLEELLPEERADADDPLAARESVLVASVLRRLTQADGGPFFALGSLRADFLGTFQQHPAWAGLPSEQSVVKPLPREQLARVIQGPATLAGLYFEEGLVEEIVRDTGTEDALPLLAFTLRELYDRRSQSSEILRRDYHDIGSVQGAIARRAERLLEEFTADSDEARVAELRAAFLSLVQPSDEGHDTKRRRAFWRDMPKPLHPILNRFVHARLLTSNGARDSPNAWLEVAHEALFRSWSTLADWIEINQAFLVSRKRWEPALERWRNDRHDDHLLQGPDLISAQYWLREQAPLLTPRRRHDRTPVASRE